MAAAIELLNPNRQWNIGSKGQLNQLDVNGNLSVANDLSVNNNIQTYKITVDELTINNTLNVTSSIFLSETSGLL